MDNNKLVAKLKEAMSLVNECVEHISKEKHLNGVVVTKKKKEGEPISDDYRLAIVNKIKNCQEVDKIEKQILDKSSVAGRILLPFYVCFKYFPSQGLTTGDIAKITSELRVGVKTPNVSKAVTESLQKYLEGNSTRVKGKPVVYRLNRKGAHYFESIINSDEK